MSEQSPELLMAKIQVEAANMVAAAERDDDAGAIEPLANLVALCQEYVALPNTTVSNLAQTVFGGEAFEVLQQLETFLPEYAEEKAKLQARGEAGEAELQVINSTMQLLVVLTKTLFEERAKYYDAFLEANGIG